MKSRSSSDSLSSSEGRAARRGGGERERLEELEYEELPERERDELEELALPMMSQNHKDCGTRSSTDAGTSARVLPGACRVACCGV